MKSKVHARLMAPPILAAAVLAAMGCSDSGPEMLPELADGQAFAVLSGAVSDSADLSATLTFGINLGPDSMVIGVQLGQVFNRFQIILPLLAPTGGLPAPGVHPVTRDSLPASVIVGLGGRAGELFLASSGSVTLDTARTDLLAGSFTLQAEDGLQAKIGAQGRFRAVPFNQ